MRMNMVLTRGAIGGLLWVTGWESQRGIWFDQHIHTMCNNPARCGGIACGTKREPRVVFKFDVACGRG